MFKYVLPLLLAAWPACARAEIESPAPLTLRAALALVDGANAELSAARHAWQAEDGAVRQAGLLPNPSLSMERVGTTETTVLLSQPLELGGKRAARVQAALRGRDGAQAQLAVRRAELRAGTMAAWFAVLAAQEQLRLTQQASELAQRAAGATDRRVAAGKVSPVESTRAQVAASTVRLELVRAQGTLSAARVRLAALWGNPVPRFERVDGRIEALPELPAPAAQRALLAASPAMLAAQAEVERRRALAQLELSRRAPDLALTVGSKRAEDAVRTQMVVGVSLPLPLFDRNQGNVLEASRRVDQAIDERHALAARMQSELAQARSDYEVARQQAAALHDDILPGAQSAYEAASAGFEYGKFGFLDVLDAQRTLLQAQTQYLNTLAEAHRALAAIERITGAEHE